MNLIYHSLQISGLKSKIRDHYHGHRVSFWLNLIPKLEKYGDEESKNFKKHLQDESKNSKISLKFMSPLKYPVDYNKISFEQKPSSQTMIKSTSSPQHKDGDNQTDDRYPPLKSASSSPPLLNKTSEVGTHILIDSQKTYSTALSATIGIGTSFLILNVFIFIGIYYHLAKNKKPKKLSRKDTEPTNHQSNTTFSCDYDQNQLCICSNHTEAELTSINQLNPHVNQINSFNNVSNQNSHHVVFHLNSADHHNDVQFNGHPNTNRVTFDEEKSFETFCSLCYQETSATLEPNQDHLSVLQDKSLISED